MKTAGYLLLLLSVGMAGPLLAQAPPADSHGTAAAAPTPAPEVAGAVVAKTIAADVTIDDAKLLNAARDQNNWLLHGRTYDNQRFSPLTQINQQNVQRLAPVSIVQTGIANSFEATPLVVNGVMYISTPGDHVLAYDAATGG